MLKLENWCDRRTGQRLRGFAIRNRQGKLVALGADGADGFLQIAARRYAHDADLVARCERLAGLRARL